MRLFYRPFEVAIVLYRVHTLYQETILGFTFESRVLSFLIAKDYEQAYIYIVKNLHMGQSWCVQLTHVVLIFSAYLLFNRDFLLPSWSIILLLGIL